MTIYNESTQSDYFDKLGSFWSKLSNDDRDLIRTYWSSLDLMANKLYMSLYTADLSRGMQYMPPYIEETDANFTIIFSGVGKNVLKVGDNYLHLLDGAVAIPELHHKISDPAVGMYGTEKYYSGVHYNVIDGGYVEFISGLWTREDTIYSGSQFAYQSTLFAPTLISYNPVLFGLYGESIGFRPSEFFNGSYEPSYISSGLADAEPYEYTLPSNELLFHFRAEDGYTVDEDQGWVWTPLLTSGLVAVANSGLLPTYTTDDDGNALFRFAASPSNYFQFNTSSLRLGDYTAVAINKHGASTKSFLIGGDNYTHLPFATKTSSNIYTFAYNYNDAFTGLIGSAGNPNAVSNSVMVSIATRNNDGSTGHTARLNGLDVTANANPTHITAPTIKYIAHRDDPGPSLKQFAGDIYEIMLYNRVITDEESQTIENYAFKKYGIAPNVGVTKQYNLSVKGRLQHYKRLIEALTSVSSNSPTVDNITKGYYLARGGPFAYEAGTASVVEDSNGNNIVGIGQYAWTINSGFTALISDAESVSKFDMLVSGVYLYDMINCSGLIRTLWSGVGNPYSKYVIQDLLSGLDTDYSSTYLDTYMGYINPAGLTYTVI